MVKTLISYIALQNDVYPLNFTIHICFIWITEERQQQQKPDCEVEVQL